MLPASIPNLAPAIPELFLVTVAMALLMLGVFQNVGVKSKEVETEAKNSRMVTNLGILTLLLTLVLLWPVVSGGRMIVFNELFITDPFAVFFKFLF